MQGAPVLGSLGSLDLEGLAGEKISKGSSAKSSAVPRRQQSPGNQYATNSALDQYNLMELLMPGPESPNLASNKSFMITHF